MEDAEEEVDEPWTVRLIQASGLCTLELCWRGGTTTDECRGTTDVSSSEPEDESREKGKKEEGEENVIE